MTTSANIEINVKVNLMSFYEMLQRHDWSDKAKIEQSSIDFFKQIMEVAKTSPAHQQLFDNYQKFVSGEVIDGVPTVSKPSKPE